MEVDGGHYDIEQVILSSQECKTVSPLTKILNYLNFDDIIGLMGAGIKSENALRTVASYIAWNKSRGDPLLLRSSALENVARIGFHRLHNILCFMGLVKFTSFFQG